MLFRSETITAAVSVPSFEAANFCTLVTRNGRSKRMALSELAAVRPSGIIAITLEDDDRLYWARLTSGKDQVILVTEQGQALRFDEDEVRAMGRAASGVTAIRLAEGDYVAGMDVVEEGGELLVITTRGFGKRTPLAEYAAKGRATGGMTTIDKNSLEKIGKIATARVVQEADELTIITSGGVALRTRVKDIRTSGRAARGVVVINVQEGDSVASVARIAEAALRQAGAPSAE